MSSVQDSKCIANNAGEVAVNNKKNRRKKENKLTVTPLRIQFEKPQQRLKEALSLDLQVSEVCPLETQIAGHGSGESGMLEHESGFVLKPVQAPPRGLREVKFYQNLYNSARDEDARMRSFAPKYYGTVNIKMANGDCSEFIVLENVTFGLGKPCVMDIKIGKITYGPDATEAKIAKESKSYSGTKLPFGFSVLGIISHSDNGFKRFTKAFGKSLDKGSLSEILDNYLNVNEKYAVSLAECFLIKLREVRDFFLTQKSFRIYGSSILFAYDYENLASNDWKSRNPVRLSLIDFAHNFPGNGEIDENYLNGLANLIKLFEKFVQDRR